MGEWTLYKRQNWMLEWLHMRGAGVDFSDDPDAPQEPVLLLWRFEGHSCPYCGHKMRKLAGRAPTRDHIIPRSAGGPDTAGNITIACRPCNRDKGNKTLPQFILWLKQRGEWRRADIVDRFMGDVQR